MAQLNDLIVTGDSRFVGSVFNNSGMVAFGTCATAAATAAKEIVINDPSWTLKVGNIIGVKYTNTNSASNVTLNVNGSGAKSIYYNTGVYTSSTNWICGQANKVIYYLYDGTYWVWFAHSYENNDNTLTAAYCTTASDTATKTAAQSGYRLLSKSYNLLTISNPNTVANALTLNINGQGAKPIYINGSASSTTNYTLPAGTYLVYYDGSNYYLRTDGKINSAAGCLIDEGSTQTISGAKTFSSTVVFSKNTDASGTADNGPAVVIGGARTAEHIEIDSNEIMAKASGTTVGNLHLNNEGGDVYINNKRVSLVYSGTAEPTSATGKDGDIYIQTS